MDLIKHYGEESILQKLDALPKESRLQKRKKGASALKITFFSLLGAGFIAVCLGAGAYGGIIADAPDVSEINIGPTQYATFVYDVQGNQIQQINEAQSNRIHVSIEEIPEDMQHAIVAIEDSRFYEHNGVDPRGMMRAAAVALSSGFQRTEGASTITQQLIKNNVFTDWTSESFIQSVQRKLQEQYLAVELEQYLTDQGLDAKSIILEGYLNTVNFGSGAYGIQTAAQTYFGKDCRDLTLSECAVLAAIPQNPTRWDPKQNPEENAQRRETVLNYMREQEWITQEELEAMSDEQWEKAMKEIETAAQEEGWDTWPNTHEQWFVEGNWEFQIEVSPDDSRVQTVEINETNEQGIGLESVMVTPFEISVKELYTGEADPADYYAALLDAEGKMIRMAEGNSEALPIYGHDISTVTVYICDYVEYMDELKGQADQPGFQELLEEWAVYKKEVHFEEQD